MAIAPYAITFLAGILVGAYVANLRFRSKVNAGLKRLVEAASKGNKPKRKK